MTANPRSPVAFLDEPFADPFVDDGGDELQGTPDVFGHLHFPSHSKGLRSAIARGKRIFEFPCGYVNGGTVNLDALGWANDIIIRGSGRSGEWFNTNDFGGPMLVAQNQVRFRVYDVSLNCRGLAAKMWELQRVFRSKAYSLFVNDSAGIGVQFGADAGELQGLTLHDCEVLHAQMRLVRGSQIASYGGFYERGPNGLPAIYVSAGELVSGPLVWVDNHHERDDLGEAFHFKGLDCGKVFGNFFVCSRGVFEECANVDPLPNYFAAGAGFDQIRCTGMGTQTESAANYVGPV